MQRVGGAGDTNKAKGLLLPSLFLPFHGQANPRRRGGGAGKAGVNPYGSRAITERSFNRGAWSKQLQATSWGKTTNPPMKRALHKGEIFQPPGLSRSP